MKRFGAALLLGLAWILIATAVIAASISAAWERDNVCRICGFDGQKAMRCYKINADGVETLYPLEEALKLCKVDEG